MQQSLQSVEHVVSMQLHKLRSDSGDDGRRRRHALLSSLQPANEADGSSIIPSIIDDLSIVIDKLLVK